MLRGEGEAPALTSAGAVRPTAADADEPGAAGTEDRTAPARAGRGAGDPGVYDRALFEALRGLRRTIAEERGVPPYLVFSDASLREMARLQPRTREAMLAVKGVGEWKCATFGERFLALIREQA